MPQLIGTAPSQIPTNGHLGSAAYADTSAFYSTGLNPFFRNRIGNGAMTIDQRRSGAALTNVTGGQDAWVADRFRIGGSVMASGRFTFQQVTDAPVGSGLYKSGKITVTTAQSSTNSYIQVLSTFIEANHFTDFEWGTAGAKSAVFSFWVKASVTGMYAVALRCDNSNATYVATYNVNTANTWEYKSISVPGPTFGTWNTGTSAALRIDFDIGCDNNQYVSETQANTWVATDAFRTQSCVRLSANSGATWQITGVQFERGTVATPFEHRPFGIELMMVQRYYWQSFDGVTPSGWPGNGFLSTAGVGGSAGGNSTGMINGQFYHPVRMRATPSGNVWDHINTAGKVSIFNPNVGNYSGETGGIVNVSPMVFMINRTSGANAGTQIGAFVTFTAEY